ncbi:histone deacetylase HOS3 [Physcia stellaris]|nr:histone deacetylase HOS3 [Physcia stellaris]
MRRTSSNLTPSSHPIANPRSELQTPIEEPPQPIMTAASVARDCLQKELDFHHGASTTTADSKMVVILQDNCYGHRYSRPRTSRAGLATIVERPERIHASILGLATAYVRLGGRHAEGHSPLNPKRNPSAYARVPFRVQKTARTLPLTSPAAISIHGAKWMSELSNMCEAAESKLALNGKELTRPVSVEQSNGNVKSERPKLHEGDLYLCSESLSALEGALGGVCEGVDAVFNESNARRAFVCIRPPGHHCSADYPSGFCWLNNVHVGIGHAALTHGLTHAAIIDFDLHHGDGSQSITWAHNARIAAMPKNTPISKKTAIGYFSLHDINSYPCEMGDEEKVRNASMCIENAHGQTIWNVHLQPWKTEADFWALYESRYIVVLEKARAFLRLHTTRLQQSPMHPQPKAAIFLSAGFDASEWESPGMQRHQVNVPTDFYARFTQDVVRLAEEEGLGADGRVISVLEGGYSDRALMSGVLSHIGGLTAMDGQAHRRSWSNGLGQDMARRLGNLNLNADLERHVEESNKPPVEIFDTSWWALPQLEEIENLVNPPAPPPPPKKQRNAVPPTYSSTTQSYSAKIVSPPPNRRSLSGNAANYVSAQPSHVRLPEQPPPPVGWATAAHELSKLLIPTDRQTKSCKPEDLNAEATRARRDRQSTFGLPTEAPVLDGKRMQLRDRRTKTPKYASEDEEEKPVSKSNRRKTIADPAMLAQETEPLPDLPIAMDLEKPTRPKSRRVSMASSGGSVNGERSSGSSLGSTIAGHPRKEALIVKKTRVPSEAPSALPKPKVVRKAPPVPRVPSAYSATSKPITQPPDEDHTPLIVNGDPANRDIDNIATGMKKMNIKLNLPPKEVQEAKETKPKPAARGRPKTTASKKNEMISKAKKHSDLETSTDQPSISPLPNMSNAEPPAIDSQDTVISDVAELQSQNTSTTEQTQSAASHGFEPNAHLSVNTNHRLLEEPPLAQPSPMVQSTQPTAFAAPANPTIPAQVSPIFPPASPPGSPIEPTPAPLPPSLHDHKENATETLFPEIPATSTPGSPPPATPKRTKHDLPIFTATSSILFGKPNPPAASNERASTPQMPTKAALEPTPSAQLTDIDMPATNGTAPSAEHTGTKESPEKKEMQQASIWDVPDTPRVRKR